MSHQTNNNKNNKKQNLIILTNQHYHQLPLSLIVRKTIILNHHHRHQLEIINNNKISNLSFRYHPRNPSSPSTTNTKSTLKFTPRTSSADLIRKQIPSPRNIQTSTSSPTSNKIPKKKSRKLVVPNNSSSSPESSREIARSSSRINSSNNKNIIINNSNDSNTNFTVQTSRNLFLHTAQMTTITDPDLKLLSAAIAPMLAQSTWASRARLLNHLYSFLLLPTSRPDLPMDARVALYIVKEKTNLAYSSRVKYAKEFRAMAHALGMTEHPTLDMYIRATSALAASAPIKQAQLIKEDELGAMVLRAWQEENNPALAVSIYLCFKTCSRWGDVANLTKENFIINHDNLNNNEILVIWGTKVKTHRLRPFKATGLTVVVEETAPDMMEELKRQIRKLKKDQKLCPKSTDQMLKWLKKKQATSRLSCHSFKRSALDKLTTAVLEEKLAPTLLPLMAKHQDKNLQHFPESTIRYLANKVALAKILKTQEATRLL